MKYTAFCGWKNGDFAACLKKCSKNPCCLNYIKYVFLGSSPTCFLYIGLPDAKD